MQELFVLFSFRFLVESENKVLQCECQVDMVLELTSCLSQVSIVPRSDPHQKNEDIKSFDALKDHKMKCQFMYQCQSVKLLKVQKDGNVLKTHSLGNAQI